MKYVTIILLLSYQIQLVIGILNEKHTHKTIINNFVDKINFNLYTQYNRHNPDIIKLYNQTTFFKSNFRRNRPLKIYIHGWLGDPFTDESLLIKNAFLDVYDVNVVIVDWRDVAIGAASYVLRQSIDVSMTISAFLDWLTIFGIKFKDIHVIGASLGGTMAGFVGRNCKKGIVPYITACDPPNFYRSHMNVNRNDGAYVEIIHTDCDYYGLESAQGHTDFYPNGGVKMPGCRDEYDHDCSHLRAYEYFSDSLDHYGYMADECKNYDEIKNNNCSKLSRLHMGGILPKNATGIFYIKTYADKPYHKQS